MTEVLRPPVHRAPAPALTDRPVAETATKRRLALVIAGFLLLLIAAYSNHFDNPFTFDDGHTIVHNTYIRDARNIPLFFTDIKYYGIVAGNQSYNPLLVTLNAIDYAIAGGLKPQVFHAHIFFWYLVQLALMFVMYTRIFRNAEPGWRSHLFTVFVVAFYGLHTANAETINYIIMRSDSFSTLCVVASLVLYQIERTRRWHLYLITMLMGILTKETGVMFAPLLFLYVLLFEEAGATHPWRPGPILRALVKTAPALIVSFGAFFLVRRVFMHTTELLSPGLSPWHYFHSQWVVIMHYLGNFLLPFDLSADPDFEVMASPWNHATLFSLIGILMLVAIAFRTSMKARTRPIAYGILWFFVALAPTSSFIPFGQIANDHRTFFPYVGAVLSLGWWLRLVYEDHRERLRRSTLLRRAVVVVPLVVLLLHAAGAYQRSRVWGSDDTLWADAAKKSPRNGRALMNYGLTLMAKGDYEGTLPYFRRTLELMPRWATIHVNMGILRGAMGFPEEAESYFKDAIALQPEVGDGYYYYARWLVERNRMPEAMELVTLGLRQSPADAQLQRLHRTLLGEVDPDERIRQLQELARTDPTAEHYLDLSLAYYRAGRFPECIAACEQVLRIDPRSALAYNNLCSAYNSLGQWERAIASCEKALAIAPDFELARNNLKWATDEVAKTRAPRAR